MHYLHVLLIAFLSCLAFTTHAARHALVIGNDSYAHIAPLKNARADARAMAKMLEDAGFVVTLVQDQARNDFNGTLRQFKAQVSGGDEVVVFYAGHGVQLGGANYLLPVDLKGESEDQIKDDAVQLQRVLDDLAEKQARFSLAIIDACRDNPLKGRGRNFATRGLAPTSAATGQMIVFSAGAGQQALDRLGDHDRTPNGLFTRVLLKEIAQTGTPIDRALKNVRSEVARLAKSVGHEQVPAIYDQSLGDFFLRRGNATAAPALPGPSAVVIPVATPTSDTTAGPEAALWSAVSATHSLEDYKAFLDRYPQGARADEARERIASLEGRARAERAKADRAAWEAAEAQADVAAYLGYLKTYPFGDFRDLARTRLGKHLPAVRQLAESGDVVAQRNLGVMYDKGQGVSKNEREAVSWYIKTAKQGDADTQGWLGKMYEEGRGIAKDEREAVVWYRKAGEKGNAGAQFFLGWMYIDGRGVKKDEREAAVWFRKAAEQGISGAQMFLGRMYIEGRGVKKDEREAVAWFRKAAEQGDAFAQRNLGDAYVKGLGVAKDEREAATWYLKAAEQGNANAQRQLGFMYADGEGVAKDEREAVVWFRKAAEQGDTYAQRRLGAMYAEGRGVAKDDREAVVWYRKAAGQGDASAQGLLAAMYAEGRGVAKDIREAMVWYRKKAEQGDADAQLEFGYRCARGHGIPEDKTEAAFWFRKAATKGLAAAQVALGYAYEHGDGVAKDEREAVIWYRKAAVAGDASAQVYLGNVYANGRGVKKDEREAVAWYRKAAAKGDVSAEVRLGVAYANGRGVKKDEREAMAWYRKAAEKKGILAESAFLLDAGFNKEDLNEVASYLDAAEQGDVSAQYALGLAYTEGRVVAKDRATAISWFRKAAAQGDEEAKKKLKEWKVAER